MMQEKDTHTEVTEQKTSGGVDEPKCYYKFYSITLHKQNPRVLTCKWVSSFFYRFFYFILNINNKTGTPYTIFFPIDFSIGTLEAGICLKMM